jgi:glycine/D-amino acid oxidase-like deaminating enzyme
MIVAPEPEPIAAHAALPGHVDTVVVGGGIIGAAAAYFLAERGVSVALCEKNQIACEQSGRNWGWCRQMGRDPRELPLIIESLKLWRALDSRLGERTGFKQCGILYLCETDQQLEAKARFLELAREHQLDTRLISGAEAERRLPGCTRTWRGALFTPSDGRAEPQLAAPAFARAAMRRGATIHTHCAVRGVETAGGRISAVVTEAGTIRCNSVVVAGGAWSRLFCGQHSIGLPQLGVVNTVARTEPFDVGIEHSFSGGSFAVRRRLDGGFTLAHRHLSVADIVPDSFRLFFKFLPALRLDWRGLRLRFGQRFLDDARQSRRWSLDRPSPFEMVRVMDPMPVQAILKQALSGLKTYFPRLAEARLAAQWAGLIDVTPDAVPVIDEVAKIPGFYLATGFSGHGFGIGPGAGRLIADLVTGAHPIVDPRPFRYSRFVDGSRLQPLAGL